MLGRDSICGFDVVAERDASPGKPRAQKANAALVGQLEQATGKARATHKSSCVTLSDAPQDLTRSRLIQVRVKISDRLELERLTI